MHLESWLKRGDGGTTELPKIYKPESVDFDELDHDYYEQAVYANKRREKICSEAQAACQIWIKTCGI